MKYNFALIIGVFFFITNISSQSNKTYSGEYTLNSSSSVLNPEYFKGKATYAYYEDENSGRVYNGAFSYYGTKNKATWDGRSTGEKIIISIKGNFKDGLKNGLFTTAITFKAPGESLSAKCKANYSEGYANGLWSITEKSESITVNFVKNKGVGKFNYNTKDTKITGTLDENGYIHGDLVWLSGTKWKETLTYDHGFQIKYVSLNRQTGEITETTLADPVQLESYKRIQEAQQKGDTAELENIPFRVKYQYYYGIYNKYNEYFKNYNLPGALPGDLSESNDYKHNMDWYAFVIKTLEKQETRDERIKREKAEEAERQRVERLKKESELKENLTKLVSSKKFEEASKLYPEYRKMANDRLASTTGKEKRTNYDWSITGDTNFVKKITKGLTRKYIGDTVLIELNQTIEAYLKNNIDNISHLADGAYQLNFNNDGFEVVKQKNGYWTNGKLKKLSEIPVKEINGFVIPLNSKLKFNVKTTTELMKIDFFSKHKKEIYHSNKEKFYAKTSSGLPQLKFEYDESVTKKMVKLVKKYKSTTRANGITVRVKEFSKNEEKEILKKE